MKISKMVKRVNELIGSGRVKYADLEGYFDEAIDDINMELYSKLPLVSTVYANTLTSYTEHELTLTYVAYSEENEYTRIPDSLIRNYLCYEVAFRRMRDDDEDPDVYGPKYAHAKKWFQKIISEYSDFRMEDLEAVAVNGDYDELVSTNTTDPRDDTALGFYNPTTGLWEGDN